MTQLPRNGEYDKWYALGILILTFFVIYYLFFQSFFTDHEIMNEEIAELEETRREYTELAFQIPELQNRIQKVRSDVGDNTSFLLADTENLGTSELTRYLKQIISENAESISECQIVSQTKSRDSKPDQFEKIILKVRMRCQFSKLAVILEKIENHVPVLFIDDLNLEQRVVRRSNKGETPPAPLLEVRFDLYAYMNKPVRRSDDD